jgi:cell division protein ZapA (FtsZ GTPase activity inhibitor)/polyhydroxyalkanoate synthesis regulator phasin
MRRLRGGDPGKNFAPGYAAILTGENGLVKEPVDPVKQKQALTERATSKIKVLVNQGAINLETSRALETYVLPQLRKQMDNLAEASVIRHRIAEVKNRVEQLNRISKKEHLLASLNRKIALAKAHDNKGRAINNLQDRLQSLRAELQDLDAQLKKAIPLKEEDYEKLLRKEGSKQQYDELVAGGHEHLRSMLSSKALSLEAFKDIVAHSGVITLCAANLLPDGLPQSEAELKTLDKEHVLGLTTEGERALRENTVLQASYRTTAIPGLIANFWKNYRENPNHWSPLYDGHVHAARLYKKEEKKVKKGKDIIRRVAHDRVTRLVGHETVNELVSVRKNLNSYQQKLARFKSLGIYGKMSLAVVEEKIAALEQTFTQAQKKAAERLQHVIVSRPGILQGSVLVQGQGRDLVRSAPPTTEEVQMANTLLNELVEMESASS